MSNRQLYHILRASMYLILLASCIGCNTSLPEDISAAYDELPDQLDYNIHVKPILSDKCFLCHGPDSAKRQAGLRLDEPDAAMATLENSGMVAITPGSLKSSEVYHRITSADPELIMPTPESHLNLSPREKAVIIKWIKDGANYKEHWALQPPVVEDIKSTNLDEWGVNLIDHFVLEKLQLENLSPAQQANKELLLRRVSFDLTGLPPSMEELKSYLADDRDDAYERQVDRLLSSPHYGEKMAIDWMDLARYSDTHGYLADDYRDVSPWRDWVIQSFNNNLPYDTFLEWQLAGDLLPDPTKEQILATTFNRLHPQNSEDGIIGEEYRVEYVSDRVSIVGTGLLGMSLACAKCHDHKFDPVSQKNFFEMYGFFNNINEAGQVSWEGATPVPTLLLPEEEEEEIINYLNRVVSEQEAAEAIVRSEANTDAKEWIETKGFQKLITPSAGTQTASNQRSRELLAHYPLDGSLSNRINPSQIGKMDRQFSANEVPTYVDTKNTKGLLLDGDAWLDLDKVGVFQRKDPFSIGLWINIPEDLKKGVIFHKNKGTSLHSYRGYRLYLTDNKLEIMLAHTWPDNAIIKQTVDYIPKDTWIHLTVTYDGSSKADGLKIYQDGKVLADTTQHDNLYKDIVFFNMVDRIYPEPIEPGLQIGGVWRGVGVAGAKVDDIKLHGVELSQLEIMSMSDRDNYKALLSKAPDDLSKQEIDVLQEYYTLVKSKEVQKSKTELQAARTKLYAKQEDIKEIMVMKEMTAPRKSYILDRGLYDSYGEEVSAGVPENIMPWPEDLPKNRLGLARWITNPDNPLTARVAVNRYWQNFFGRGIVSSTEDFGNQGTMPSHPQLLDWLAVEFVSSGWDVKQLHKSIVMSATYRQDSYATPELLNRDPDNVLLARGPNVRLTSEMIRDNALAASGLLNPEIGGESVYPYQPDGLWSMNTGNYKQDVGDKLYRRSLYSIWKRTVPNPTLYTFDQPDREICTVKRQKTNTPLQALVLLNDPTFLETAKVIGETITRKGSAPENIAAAFRNITGVEIGDDQLKVLAALQQSEYQIFKSDKEKKKGWIKAGDYKIDPSLDGDLVAANAVVASVILNSDASITKR